MKCANFGSGGEGVAVATLWQQQVALRVAQKKSTVHYREIQIHIAAHRRHSVSDSMQHATDRVASHTHTHTDRSWQIYVRIYIYAHISV